MEAHVPQVGEIYRWAGKRWLVVSVDEAHGRAKIENVDRRFNTATMPFSKFTPEARS